jgi:hypothetical protein
VLCKLTFVVALLICCVLGNGEEIKGKADVRFRLLQNAMIVVPVVIDGQGPFDFILDTGTESSLIDPKLARRLNLNSADHLTLYTSNGYNNVIRAFIPKLLVGKASAEHVEVLVGHLDGVTALDSNLRGILGQNFLRQFDLMLDYEHEVATFFSASTENEPSDGTRVPLLYTHGCPTLMARVADGTDLQLMLDSGASALLFFKKNIPGMRSCRLFECGGTLRSTLASTQVNRGVLGDLSLGDASFREISAYVFDQISSVQAEAVDGLFPTSLLRSVFFNNRKGYAILSRNQR